MSSASCTRSPELSAVAASALRTCERCETSILRSTRLMSGCPARVERGVLLGAAGEGEDRVRVCLFFLLVDDWRVLARRGRGFGRWGVCKWPFVFVRGEPVVCCVIGKKAVEPTAERTSEV